MSIRSHLVPAIVLLLLGTAPLAAQQPAPATPDSARIALARRLLVLIQPSDSGTAAMLESVMPIRKLGPMMPPGVRDSIQAAILRIGPIVQDSTAVLYAGRFTTPELHDLVAFYGSPLGRKLTREQAAMTGEIMNLYQRLMMPVMEEQMARIMSGIRPPGGGR